MFQYPFPLTETEFLVTYAPLGWKQDRTGRKASADFGIYWMDMDGRRELLATDADAGLPAAGAAGRAHARRRRGPARSITGRTTGTFYMQDIYAGPGLAGVPRGTIKKLRVVGA